MTKNLKIGIVGIGTIADIHALAIQASENTELLSAYSRNKEKAKRFAEKYNIRCCTDWIEFWNWKCGEPRY